MSCHSSKCFEFASPVDYSKWARIQLEPCSPNLEFLLFSPPIGTVDFYRGTANYNYLRNRLQAILVANPWLTGHLVRDRDVGIVVMVPPSRVEVNNYIVVHEDVGITPGMPYAKMAKLLMQYGNVKTGRELIGRGLPLIKLTIFPAGETGYALMLSLNHAVADGFTFYRLRNMLDPKAEVVSLRLGACEEAAIKGDALSGTVKSKAILNVSNLLVAMLRGLGEDSTEPVVKYVNDRWITAEKQAWSGIEVPYVSTNDILTSWYMKKFQVQFGWMAVNWRGRIRCLDDKHAGNFEGMCTYWNDECDSPVKIRKSISHDRDEGVMFGGSRDVPPSKLQRFGMFGAGMSGVTNWSTFFKDVEMPDSKHQTHLPVMDVAICFSGSVMVIFKVNSRTTACFCYARSHAMMESLADEGVFGGDLQVGVAPMESTAELPTILKRKEDKIEVPKFKWNPCLQQNEVVWQ